MISFSNVEFFVSVFNPNSPVPSGAGGLSAGGMYVGVGAVNVCVVVVVVSCGSSCVVVLVCCVH